VDIQSLAQINATVGDLTGNCARIVEAARRAHAQGARLVLTPELALCGQPAMCLVAFRSRARKFDVLVVRRSFFAADSDALDMKSR